MLAGRGMVCVQVLYRLLDKKGSAPPLTCVEDAKSALRWVRAHAGELGVDPDRLAAGGGSAGGHLAAFVGMVEGLDDPQDDRATSPRANALVLFNPVLDNGPDGGYGYQRVGKRFREFSPAHNVTPDDPPTLVLLGTKDALIPQATMKRSRANMVKAGVRCEVIYAEGQGHGYFNSEPWKTRILGDVARFLESLGWLTAPTPGKLSLTRGTTWAGNWTFRDPGFDGKVAEYSFTVTERRGNQFRGEGRFLLGGPEYKTSLVGTIQRDGIDYHETGDQAYEFHVVGQPDGGTINLQFHGTGAGGQPRFGTGTLRSR